MSQESEGALALWELPRGAHGPFGGGRGPATRPSTLSSGRWGSLAT